MSWMVGIFSWVERWNFPFTEAEPRLNGTFHLSTNENIPTIQRMKNIHYLFYITTDRSVKSYLNLTKNSWSYRDIGRHMLDWYLALYWRYAVQAVGTGNRSIATVQYQPFNIIFTPGSRMGEIINITWCGFHQSNDQDLSVRYIITTVLNIFIQ